LDTEGKIYRKKGEVRARVAQDGDPRAQYEKLPADIKAALTGKNFNPETLKGKRGELIVTRLKDGTVETANVAAPGDWIVTNPGGEEYVPGNEKFLKRYEPKPGQSGVFIAKGYCKAVKNPFNEPIRMMASWNEMQSGGADCIIAVVYDMESKKDDNEPYIIGVAEFSETYVAV
jgi:hypothetical protein